MESNLDDYILQDKIGSGSFGKVYKVKNKLDGKIYAAKIAKNLYDDQDPSIFTDVISEVDIISKLNHPLVLKFLLFSPYNFKGQLKPVIITEYAPNGSLSQLIEQSKNISNFTILDDTFKLIIITEIASAMAYLHLHDIIHRDLKPENILLDEFYIPKIADFGLSKITSQTQGNNAIKTSFGTVKGTPIYMAPEIWNSSKYSQSSDVYAFAIVVYEIMTLKRPFKDVNIFNLGILVDQGVRPDLDEQIPEAYKFLIQRCWLQDPSSRPTFQQIYDELINSPDYRTENFDENLYDMYINNFITRFATFDNDRHDYEIYESFENIQQHQNSEKEKEFLDSILNASHFPFKYLNGLKKESLNLIKEAELGDNEKQFRVAQNLIKGLYDFPTDVQVGLDYLKRSMKNGYINSIVYYIKMLIKGDIIPPNHSKAIKLIEKHFKTNESIRSFLYGKLFKKKKKYIEAHNYFQQSMKEGNIEAFYEDAELLRKGYYQQENPNDNNNNNDYDEEMINLYKKASDDGNSKAMYQLAVIKNDKQLIKMAADKGCAKAMFYYGIELEAQDKIDKSIEYFKKAADEGHIESMNKYAHILINKFHEKGNIEQQDEIVKYLKKASDKGCIKSMFEYGKILIEGDAGVTPNPDQGISYIKIAEKNQYTEAIAYHFALKILSPIKQNRIEYFIDFIELFKEGNDSALNSIITILLNSYCQANMTYTDMIHFLELLIEKGNSVAMNNYAYLLQKGIFVPEANYQEAIKYYKMAIERNNYDALTNYAYMIENGQGVEIDYQKAIELYKIAIDDGNNHKAMSYYADMLLNGRGIEVNYQEAVKYYKMAIKYGDSNAMTSYALMLQKGQGVELDFKKAREYYEMAINKNNTDAMLLFSRMIIQCHSIRINVAEIQNYLTKIDERNRSPLLHLYAVILFYAINIEHDYEYIFNILLSLCGFYLPANATVAYLLESIPIENAINDSLMISNIYKNAIEEGGSLSMTLYARMISKNENQIQEAIKYYKMAIDCGNYLAMAYYGRMLQLGKGCDVDYQEAIELFKKGIANYEPKAMTYYGLTYQDGLGVDVDYNEAIKYYKMAIDRYDTEAMILYALMLQKGQGVKVNNEESVNYIQMAIECGDSEAMNIYALMLQNGQGVEVNYKKAQDYYQKAISHGNISAIKNYALMFHYNLSIDKAKGNFIWPFDVEKNPSIIFLRATIYQHYHKDYETALKTYKDSIGKGYSESISYCAYMYQKGLGTDVDYQEAIRLYKIAMDKGDSFAFANYAYMLEYGQGVDIDYQEAIRLYKIAIEKGDSIAMNLFADMIQNGHGIDIDYKESQNYYRMSIAKGNLVAMDGYADLIHKYNEIEIDFNEAVKCYNLVFELNDVNTLYLYASMLHRGKGVDKNVQKSALYYQKAINLRHVKSMIYFAELIQNSLKDDDNFCLLGEFQKMVFLDKLPPAMYIYATMLHYGFRYDVDIDEAIKYYKKAASKGVKEAQVKIDELCPKEEEDQSDSADEDLNRLSNFSGENNYFGLGGFESRFGLDDSSSSDDFDCAIDFFHKSTE